MKWLSLSLLLTLCVSAEHSFEFNPTLLVEAEIAQEFTKKEGEKIPKAQLGLGKVEAGFELAFDKVSGIINFEYDAEDEGRILLNEALSSITPNEYLTISAGQFVNSFGLIESEGLSDPLIFDDIETKAPALQFDFAGEKLFGAATIYQGMHNEDFRSFVPAIGVNLNDKFTAKLSSRIELLDDTSYVDLNAAFALTPIELLKVQAELYSELNTKLFTEEESEIRQKVLGYYAEVSLYPKEKVSIVTRFDQRITDIDGIVDAGALAIELSGGYQLFEPFCIHAGLQFVNEYTGNSDDWNSVLAIQAAFEL